MTDELPSTGPAFEITWTRAAITDLDLIIEYVAQSSGHGRAVKLYEKLRGTVDNLRKLPDRGRVVPELSLVAIREFREVIDRPYRIVFRIDENKIILVGILDARRDLESLLVDRALRL